MKSRSTQTVSSVDVPLAIKGRGIRWTPDLRRLFDHRLQKVTELYQDQIVGITATLEDANGPRGGIDKTCRLNVQLRHRGPVSVSASSTKSEAAIVDAFRRTKEALARKQRSSKIRTSRRESESN